MAALMMSQIVPADSPISSPADLKGRSLAFTSPTSNSGFKAPSAILKSEFGLVADTDFEAAFSGKHDNSVLGVANKDYEAAAVANSVLNRMIRREVVDAAKVRSIYKSQTFPTTGYGHAHNLAPRGRREDQAGILHVSLGRVGSPGRVQEGRQVRRHLPQAGLGHHPQDRQGRWRQLRLQVTHDPRHGPRGPGLSGRGVTRSRNRREPAGT